MNYYIRTPYDPPYGNTEVIRPLFFAENLYMASIKKTHNELPHKNGTLIKKTGMKGMTI